jgi:hypothetical protein
MIDIHYQKSEKKPETVQTQLDQPAESLVNLGMRAHLMEQTTIWMEATDHRLI